MDFPRAWEIARAAPMDDHDPRCSFRQTSGALLCDCHIVNGHPEAHTAPTVRPFADLTDSGLLWLINMSVLHPRGVALALAFDDAGHATGWRLLGDGGEPWSFPDSEEIHAKMRAANATIAQGERVGATIHPEATEPRMSQVPTVGRIVHYTLSAVDADQINRRRADAEASRQASQGDGLGYLTHVGNRAEPGQVLPMTIVRVWGGTPESAVNGQVLLDGNDSLWVTSRTQGEGESRWAWPPRA